MKTTSHKLILTATATAYLSCLSICETAQADWITSTQTFGNSSFAGPYDTVEIFIVSDPGGAGPFQNSGITFSTVAPATPGWSTDTPNPFYSLASGPAHDGDFDISFLFAGDMNNTIELDMIIWDGGIGSTIHFASSFLYANGVFGANNGESFGAGPHSFLLHPDGIGYDRSVSVPEPSSCTILLRRRPALYSGVGVVPGKSVSSNRRKTDWRHHGSSGPVLTI